MMMMIVPRADDCNWRCSHRPPPPPPIGWPSEPSKCLFSDAMLLVCVRVYLDDSRYCGSLSFTLCLCCEPFCLSLALALARWRRPLARLSPAQLRWNTQILGAITTTPTPPPSAKDNYKAQSIAAIDDRAERKRAGR